MRSIAVLLLAAATFVSAETFKVIVGRDEAGEIANVFTPNQVTAKVDDIIQFEFRAKNHTVTQSSFAEPCTRQLNTATGLLGVDSGFLPSAEGATEIPMWEIRVLQDTAPIWMFCARVPHCNAGMVFAINAPQEGERTFANFLEKAATANSPQYEDNVTAPFTPPNADSDGSSSSPPSESSTETATETSPSDAAEPTDAETDSNTADSTTAASSSVESLAADTAPTGLNAAVVENAGFRLTWSRAGASVIGAALLAGLVL